MVAEPTNPSTWMVPSASKLSLSKADLIVLPFLGGSARWLSVDGMVAAHETASTFTKPTCMPAQGGALSWFDYVPFCGGWVRELCYISTEISMHATFICVLA